jgi:hypothetical protein
MRAKVSPWMKGLVVFGIVGTIITLLAIPGPMSSRRASNDLNALASLRTVAAAQFDLRSHDLDRNGQKDYWRSDIAGLYCLVPPGSSSGDPLRLIEITIATADVAPSTTSGSTTLPSGPKAGYHYRALHFQDEDPRKPDPDRFAAHAFPVSQATGRIMFIVSHDGRIWKKAAASGGVLVFPSSPADEGWTAVP